MFVSVVLPCYNGASTLAEMLDSLVAQTYEGAWELVFVNNGSTDNSVEVAMSYAGRLPIHPETYDLSADLARLIEDRPGKVRHYMGRKVERVSTRCQSSGEDGRVKIPLLDDQLQFAR